MPTTSTAFVDRCRDEVGEALRAVTVYDEEGYETVYRREGVEGIEGTRFAALVAAARDVHSPMRLLAGHEDGALGGYESSLHAFGDALVYQFAAEPRMGYLVCVDRDPRVDPVEELDGCTNAL